MKLELSPRDRSSFDRLMHTAALNNVAIELYSSYLNFTPRFVTRELMDDISAGVDRESMQYAYAALLAAAMGLDTEKKAMDRAFFRNYVIPSVTMLDPGSYVCDPYYQNVKLKRVKFKDWELTCRSYEPFEAFIWRSTACEVDGREIPQLGFFENKFEFPAVLQNGREWMTVTPNEIETMRAPIAAAKGKVVTFGLGLGYFAYMAARKDEVESVTVVERDRDVIALFSDYILPQLECREKIKVICADAFDFAENTRPNSDFDFAFADIWHDAGDGLELYARMRRLEELSPKTEFAYWIEDSLLCQLRRIISAELDSGDGATLRNYSEVAELLTDNSLRELAKSLQKA